MWALVALFATVCAAAPPNLIMLLQDDLGYADVGWNNPAMADVSGNLTKLAQEGVVLKRHYVFYWCSPTRRSFLTGRLPVHHGEMLSAYTGDDIDLRWKIISQKLKPKGYKNYWIGKGHTGYKSMKHLPINRGFDNHTGFLIGSQSYTSTDRWHDQEPLHTDEYSTTLYGDDALSILRAHDPATPMFMYLPWQAVHAPYDDVPGWPHNGEQPAGTYRGMLWAADVYIGRLIALLKEKSMYNNTLIVYASDNGGRGDGINFPYRGEKRTNYEGGMRVAAFVSGGLVPESVRGTSSDIRMHIVDWYPTFCHLAGVDASDDPPVPPMTPPADDPPPAVRGSRSGTGPDWQPETDIYGQDSWPGVDGVNVWPMITNPAKYNRDSAHATIVLSHEVIISGPHKLMVAQRGNTKQSFDLFEAGWCDLNYTWRLPANRSCGMVETGKTWQQMHFEPCLYDLEADPREETDLSPTNPELRDQLYKQLNDTWKTYYYSRSPAAMVGYCDPACANARWVSLHGISGHGPECDVPGCTNETIAIQRL